MKDQVMEVRVMEDQVMVSLGENPIMEDRVMEDQVMVSLGENPIMEEQKLNRLKLPKNQLATITCQKMMLRMYLRRDHGVNLVLNHGVNPVQNQPGENLVNHGVDHIINQLENQIMLNV